MLIRISDLPAQGMEVLDKLSLTALNARMNEASNNDIVFEDSPQISGQIKPISGGVSFEGQLTTKYSQPCARCNDDLHTPLQIDFSIVFKPESEKHNNEDEEDVVYYEGDQIEVEEVLQEYIIIALNPFYSPPCNESGDCSVCGFNLNQYCDEVESSNKDTVKLGDLLKKAISKN